eukprot:GHRR01015666.1.p1 GENE.GHRR01015666.1~~GHRR01015666.1.p1  ORF type:complete len:276 (+),score=95.46 GHRR01015666.1:88-915(+)
MSLYGDLPQAKDEDSGSKGWAAASKKLQPTFRKPSSLLAPPSVLRGGPGRGSARTPTSAGRGAGRTPTSVTNNVLPASAGPFVGSNSNPMPAAVHSAFSFFTVNGQPLQDEYDPSRPNDYEEIVKQREKRKKEAEEEAERLARLREIEQEIERRKREQAEAAAFVAAAAKPPLGAPPLTQQQQYSDDDEAEHTFQGLGATAAGFKQEPGIKQDPDEGFSGLGLGSSGTAAGGSSSGEAPAAAASDNGMDEYERERQRRLKMSGEDAFKARGRVSG